MSNYVPLLNTSCCSKLASAFTKTGTIAKQPARKENLASFHIHVCAAIQHRIDISIKVNYISNSKHISQRRSQQSIRIKTRATEINANRLLPQSVSIERGGAAGGRAGGRGRVSDTRASSPQGRRRYRATRCDVVNSSYF